MEIILIKPLRKLGKIGDFLKVADGFARNYLLPQKLAISATATNKDLIAKQKEQLIQKDQLLRQEMGKINKLINGRKLTFIRQSSDDGKLFGSVSNKEIADQLTKIASYAISCLNIVLDKQIKSIGVYEVEVRLHAELSSMITLIVARSESEAQDYLHEDKETLDESASI